MSPITHTPFIGFSHELKEMSQWLLKKDCTGEFIGGVISFLSEGEALTEKSAFERAVTVNGKHECDLIIKHPDRDLNINQRALLIAYTLKMQCCTQEHAETMADSYNRYN